MIWSCESKITQRKMIRQLPNLMTTWNADDKLLGNEKLTVLWLLSSIFTTASLAIIWKKLLIKKELNLDQIAGSVVKQLREL